MNLSFFKTCKKGIVLLSEILVGLSFLVLIVAVTIQVTGRTFVLDSPVWTEELTRFALLYLTAFGVGVSYLKGDLVNVDIICEALPGKIPLLLRLVSAILIALLCISLLQPAWRFAEIGVFQTSPALGIKMHFIHASILILLCSLLACACIRICQVAIELKSNGESR